MQPRSIDQALEDYRGLVEALASKLSRSPRARQTGVEKDDLEQEGYIAVWLAVQRGVNPLLTVENRMKDYIRFQGRTTPVAYEALLPIEVVNDLSDPQRNQDSAVGRAR